MLEAIREVDKRAIAAREKLTAVAAFIIDSYRHDPDLMKVIIVEVTRAANSFGRRTWPRSARPTALIADIVRDAQAEGAFRDDVDAEFAAMAFYGVIEQVLTGWIFGVLPSPTTRLRAGEAAGRRDDLRRAGRAVRRRLL